MAINSSTIRLQLEDMVPTKNSHSRASIRLTTESLLCLHVPTPHPKTNKKSKIESATRMGAHGIPLLLSYLSPFLDIQFLFINISVFLVL